MSDYILGQYVLSEAYLVQYYNPYYSHKDSKLKILQPIY
ncbi:hypothetical protein P23_3380 [Acinetobacter calcoaceticus]|nr:hypothetical protein P23_3380 [Acinetobacter calcoaceticus]